MTGRVRRQLAAALFTVATSAGGCDTDAGQRALDQADRTAEELAYGLAPDEQRFQGSRPPEGMDCRPINTATPVESWRTWACRDRPPPPAAPDPPAGLEWDDGA